MKRIGIFGGTFDPIHNGHIALLENAQRKFKFHKILIIPTKQNPLKNRCFASSKDRAAMVRIAIKPLKYVSLCSYEINRNRLSYTINTIKYLRRRFGSGAEFFFIGGDDLMKSLPRWKSYKEILNECKFAITTRNLKRTELQKANCDYFPMRKIEISSTNLKKKLMSDSKKPSGVSENVYQYIRKKALYKK